MKIQQGKGILFIALPIEYCRLLGWQKGTELAVFPSGTEPRTMIVKEVAKLKKQMTE